jgi:glutamine amidotransferase
VCVGVQLLFARSAESDTPCLGIIDGTVEKLRGAAGVRIPHMGWNRIEVVRAHPLLDGLDGQYAYFVHSYAAPSGAWTRASCEHGQVFSAVVARDNFCGAQFHPERSAATGARLLDNFLKWDGSYTC